MSAAHVFDACIRKKEEIHKQRGLKLETVISLSSNSSSENLFFTVPVEAVVHVHDKITQGSKVGSHT